MASDMTPRVRLADAIAELRTEISNAHREGKGKDVRFAAKSIEVELSFEFGLTAEVKAGLPKWVPFIDLGAKGGGSGKSLNKVKLTLEIDTQGDPSKSLIGDEDGPSPVSTPNK